MNYSIFFGDWISYLPQDKQEVAGEDYGLEHHSYHVAQNFEVARWSHEWSWELAALNLMSHKLTYSRQFSALISHLLSDLHILFRHRRNWITTCAGWSSG